MPATCNETNTISDGQLTSRTVSRASDASTKIVCNSPDQTPVLSRKRWQILFAVSILGLCQTLATDTSAILNQVMKLLDLSAQTYTYVNQIFTALMILLAVPSAMFLDKFGIRVTILVAACLFVISGIFEALLFFTELPGWPHYKMYFFIISRLFNTETMNFFILLPLKVSETWFPETERSAAWMMMFLQMEIGVCVASFVYPRTILGIGDFKILSYVTIASVTISLITCVALVTKSEPPNPPSRRAASKDIVPISVSLKRILKERDILLHMIHHSVLTALSIALSGLMQNILSTIGYSQIFAGNYMLINAAISFVLSIIMASFVHKIHNSTMACKLSSLIQAIIFIALLMTISESLPGPFILGASIMVTACKSFTIPNFNEMTAHLASGILSPATMIGFSLVVTPIICSLISVTFAYLIETHNDTNDYHNSLKFLMVVSIANELVYQIFFKGKSSGHSDDGDHLAENEEQNDHCP